MKNQIKAVSEWISRYISGEENIPYLCNPLDLDYLAMELSSTKKEKLLDIENCRELYAGGTDRSGIKLLQPIVSSIMNPCFVYTDVA